MSDNTSTTNSNTSAQSKAPTHSAYQVRDGKSGKSFWTKIGSAWPHADGQGFNLQLDCVPLDGRVSLRIISEKREQQ